MCPVHIKPSTDPLTVRTCDGCGDFVSQGFTRVFGDNDDRVACCPNCAFATEFGSPGPSLQ
jgi:hypothetical protein